MVDNPSEYLRVAHRLAGGTVLCRSLLLFGPFGRRGSPGPRASWSAKPCGLGDFQEILPSPVRLTATWRWIAGRLPARCDRCVQARWGYGVPRKGLSGDLLCRSVLCAVAGCGRRGQTSRLRLCSASFSGHEGTPGMGIGMQRCRDTWVQAASRAMVSSRRSQDWRLAWRASLRASRARGWRLESWMVRQ